MSIDTTKATKDLASEIPGATRIFHKLGIDYCCGGDRSLQEACRSSGVNLQDVVRSLEEAERARSDHPHFKNWKAAASLSQLMAHILSVHHTFTRNQLEILETLMPKVCSAHAERHPELLPMRTLFSELRRDLLSHMQKEEEILFPYVETLEKASEESAPFPTPLFGTVTNPIRMMMLEHDTAAEILEEMRTRSADFSPPEDACTSYRILYREFERLERDLHEHIHLENNILFPRAIDMEERLVERQKTS